MKRTTKGVKDVGLRENLLSMEEQLLERNTCNRYNRGGRKDTVSAISRPNRRAGIKTAAYFVTENTASNRNGR